MTIDVQSTSSKEAWKAIQKRQKQRVWTANHSDTGERKDLLKRLRRLITDHEQEWFAALEQDLGKPAMETFASEIAVLLNEIDFMERHLTKWQRPDKQLRVRLSGIHQTRVEKRPYGSVLVISPWNYPLHLALFPVVGALAAGNSCFIKPSEFAPATSQLLEDLVSRYFAPEVLTVVQGDETVAQELVDLPWDFIFFTGSKKVGAIIHQAAAKKQIPVVLELSGKNPCIVDETHLSKAMVQRIAWGKFMNAGQTCIAPDTVYVQETIYPEFLALLTTVIEEFYGTNAKESDSFGRIAHQKQFDKMKAFLQEGTIHYGGHYDEDQLYVEPTVVTQLSTDSALLTEEIFGPILPVVPYSDLASLVHDLQQKESPLAVYLFSQDSDTSRFVEQQLRSGSFSVNQVILQTVAADQPFGGIGASGIGRYHGTASLETFSYRKSVLKTINAFNGTKQYPPYQKKDLSLLRKVRKWLI